MDYIVNFTKEGSAVIEAESVDVAYDKAMSIDDSQIDWGKHFIYSKDDINEVD